MDISILSICYLVASVTFIIGLKMLSNPSTARRGNLIAAGGMIIAIAGTIFLYRYEGKKLGIMDGSSLQLLLEASSEY